jgi:hypothetical protein
MHVQKGLLPHDRFVRCIGMGPQTRIVSYDPGAPLHERYQPDTDLVASGTISAEEATLIRDTTMTINAFFGWDFNSCESLRSGGNWHPIDFANPCPDSQVTSLHYHFPWMIKANIRWSVFVAATGRRMRRNLDWQPFLDAAETADREGMDLRQRLALFARIANEHMETERFAEFCATHLGHLDEVAWEFFGTDVAHDAVHQKVVDLFPAHEVDEFTDLFWERIQRWREDQRVLQAGAAGR